MEHAQKLLLRAVTASAWTVHNSTFSWLPFEHGEVGSEVLDHRYVQIVGGSTGREMVEPVTLCRSTQVCEAARRATNDTSPKRPHAWDVDVSNGWQRTEVGCNASIGSGCADCWACCQSACRGAHTPLRTFAAVSRGWADYIYHQQSRGRTVGFSWKPEWQTAADEALLSSRLCAGSSAGGPPVARIWALGAPDLLYVTKGLHDACVLNISIAEIQSRIQRFARSLSCLPSSTIIVVRTPYFHPADSSAARTVCHYPIDEVGRRIRAVRDEIWRLHREQAAFGASALVLDAYALTMAAERTGRSGVAAARALKSIDGHHYPITVRDVERKLLSFAMALALNASSRRPSR